MVLPVFLYSAIRIAKGNAFVQLAHLSFPEKKEYPKENISPKLNEITFPNQNILLKPADPFEQWYYAPKNPERWIVELGTI